MVNLNIIHNTRVLVNTIGANISTVESASNMLLKRVQYYEQKQDIELKHELEAMPLIAKARALITIKEQLAEVGYTEREITTIIKKLK